MALFFTFDHGTRGLIFETSDSDFCELHNELFNSFFDDHRNLAGYFSGCFAKIVIKIQTMNDFRKKTRK